MPNVASVLKEEISRLARKELRTQLEGIKKSSATHRKDIATLKREISGLERQVAILEKRVLGESAQASAADPDSNVRFTAKGLKSQRNRLGLSAKDYARLAGVSALSVYNWEKGSIRPRKSQIANLATLRGIGKKEAMARIGVLSKPKTGAKKKAGPKKKAAKK